MSDVVNQTDTPQQKEPSEPLFRSIVFAAVVGFGVVSFWRGVWYLWDVLVFPEPEQKLYSGLASTITGIVILTLMRTFYSALAPPLQRMNIR
ncbi:MAG: hypothetical protein HOI35_03625 [Woeseia sp.]|nr:hypothetical protein [Woeseia sp.]MBT6209095.1 hypothetical protein [Woeseia sp.]